MLCVRHAFLGMLAERSVGRRTIASVGHGRIHMVEEDEVL